MSYSVVVDVGSFSIKVIEGFERKGKLTIRKIGYFENPVPNFRTNFIESDQKALSNYIRGFLKRYGINARETISSVCGADVIVHYFDIPELSQEEIRSAVQLEALQVIPGGIENLEYDYQVLSSGGRRTVLLIGYQKEKCNFFVSTLTYSGLKPIVMDVDGLALCNCYYTVSKNPRDAICIINVGAQYTNLAIAEKDGCVFVRDIQFGGAKITSAVVKAKSVSPVEAEYYKRDSANARAVSEIVKSESQDMLGEILAGLRYFETRIGKKPSGFLLTGGSALLPGLHDLLEISLGIPGAVWNPLDEIRGSQIPVDVQASGSMFAVALGLLSRKIL